MALQLAYNLWQYDRQNKNVEKIVKTAADLYDKVAGFEDTFM
ncbi:RhuM protein, partial [human gut metagenome]